MSSDPRLNRTPYLLFLGLFLAGCDPAYVGHVAVGEVKLLASRKPVEEVLQESQLSHPERLKIHRDRSFFEEVLAQYGDNLRDMIAFFKSLLPEQIPVTFRNP